MINIYKTNISTKRMEEIDKIVKGCWINMVAPTIEEIASVASTLNISEQLLKYPLDISERPHIDKDLDQILIIVDVPAIEIKNGMRAFTTMPLGIISVRDDIFITISNINSGSIDSILNGSKKDLVFTEQKSRFVFKILYNIANDYIKYMSYISKDIEDFENHMYKSMTNKELMQLLEFEKSMIYFSTSIKANQVVLQKINRGNTIKLYDEDLELLEDTIIENTQAMEMVKIYSEILNGIIEIFGTIINNNVNTVMKFLAAITIIIAIPTMVASFMGMNVTFPFSTGIEGFIGITFLAIIVTVFSAIWLKNKNML